MKKNTTIVYRKNYLVKPLEQVLKLKNKAPIQYIKSLVLTQHYTTELATFI